MSIEQIESSIDEDLNRHMRSSLLSGVLKNAGTTKLPDLVKLTEHDRFGGVASDISLQEIIDAYVEAENLVPETYGEKGPAEPVKTGRRKTGKKAAKKKAAKKKPSTGGGRKGGGGGSAEPGRQINFRDPEERKRYSHGIEMMVREREGEAVSSTELVDKCGGSSNQAREILKALVDEGKVVYVGLARATRYYWRAQASDEVIAEYQKQIEAESAGNTAAAAAG